MVKRVLLFILALLLVTGCSIARASTPGGGPLTGEATTPDGIVIRTQAEHSKWTWGKPTKVTVTVKNGGKEPISYVRFNGCDPGIGVVLLQGGQQVGLFRPEGPERACAQVIDMASLAPGAEIRATMVWEQLPDQTAPAPGEYTLQVAFNRGAHYDALQPLTDQIKIQVGK